MFDGCLEELCKEEDEAWPCVRRYTTEVWGLVFPQSSTNAVSFSLPPAVEYTETVSYVSSTMSGACRHDSCHYGNALSHLN